MNWMTWYNGLAKPSWTPAPSTIGFVWQILYPIILLTFGFVFVQVLRGKISWLIALPFVINLVANVIFTPIQFGMRNLPLASVDILVVWSSIIWLAVAVWPFYRWVAVAQVPYFVWVSIATYLQLFITWNNRQSSTFSLTTGASCELLRGHKRQCRHLHRLNSYLRQLGSGDGRRGPEAGIHNGLRTVKQRGSLLFASRPITHAPQWPNTRVSGHHMIPIFDGFVAMVGMGRLCLLSLYAGTLLAVVIDLLVGMASFWQKQIGR